MIQLSVKPKGLRYHELSIGDTFVDKLESPSILYIKTEVNEAVVVYSIEDIKNKRVRFNELVDVYKVSITVVWVVHDK